MSTNLLFQALLDKDPVKRASLWHLKEHQWMVQVDFFPVMLYILLLQEVDPLAYELYDVIPCSEAELRPPTHYREGGCGRMAGRPEGSR